MDGYNYSWVRKMKKSPKFVIKRAKRYAPPRGIYGERFEYWWDLAPGVVARIKEYGKVTFEKKDSGEQCIVDSQTLLKHLTKQRQTSRKAHPWGIRVLVGHPNELAIEPGLGGAGGWEYITVNWRPPNNWWWKGMRNVFVTGSTKSSRLLEDEWRRFFMGYLAGPVPETEMVKFKVQCDVGHKAGIYYFVLFRLSIKAVIDSEEIVAIVSDANGDLDQSLSGAFLDIVRSNLSKNGIQPNLSFSPKVFAILRDMALDYMSKVKSQTELTACQRNDALIAIWSAATEQAFEAQKQRATSKLKAATDNRVVRMYQEVLRGLESRLQNTRAELKARKQVSIVYEPAAYGLMELLGE